MRQTPHFVTCFVLALLAVASAGCGPASPEEQVAATRAQYTVRLESFTAEEPPPAVEEMMMEEAAEAVAAVEEAAEAAEAAEETAEGEESGEVLEEEAPVESGPRATDVILHLLVRFGGKEALPGITVEVTQADPFGKEKEPTLHWIETAGMVKSDVKQVDLKLEGLEFEEGDAFAVLLRAPVPAEQRSQYREFTEAGP